MFLHTLMSAVKGLLHTLTPPLQTLTVSLDTSPSSEEKTSLFSQPLTLINKYLKSSTDLRLLDILKYRFWMPALVRTPIESNRSLSKKPHKTKRFIMLSSNSEDTPGRSLRSLNFSRSFHNMKYPFRYIAQSSLITTISPLIPNSPDMATIFSSLKKSTSKGK